MVSVEFTYQVHMQESKVYCWVCKKLPINKCMLVNNSFIIVIYLYSCYLLVFVWFTCIHVIYLYSC